MDISILFEDQTFIVINKPAGLTVNRSETTEYTLQDWIEENNVIARSKATWQSSGSTSDKNIPNASLDSSQSLRMTPKLYSEFLNRSGIVHRLDKETSGCLIVAKTPESFVELQRQFKNREVKKEYLALVHGQVESEEGTINVPLSRSRFDRQKIAVTPGGRISETSYQVTKLLCHPERVFESKDLSKKNYFTLLRLFPKTGRTHQIRVHLQYFGHPIVADDKYAGEKQIKEDHVWCPRLFLHAVKITFIHPDTNKIVSIESGLPEELYDVILRLCEGSSASDIDILIGRNGLDCHVVDSSQ